MHAYKVYVVIEVFGQLSGNLSVSWGRYLLFTMYMYMTSSGHGADAYNHVGAYWEHKIGHA